MRRDCVTACACLWLLTPDSPPRAAGAVTLERTLAIEKETQHDIMAVVKAICAWGVGFGHAVASSALSPPTRS